MRRLGVGSHSEPGVEVSMKELVSDGFIYAISIDSEF
jgi:hypothetical protein